MSIDHSALLLKGYECGIRGNSVFIEDKEVFRSSDEDVAWEVFCSLGLDIQTSEYGDGILIGAILVETDGYSELDMSDVEAVKKKVKLDSFVEVNELPEPKLFIVHRVC